MPSCTTCEERLPRKARFCWGCGQETEHEVRSPTMVIRRLDEVRSELIQASEQLVHLAKLRVDRLANDWAGNEDEPTGDRVLAELREAYEDYLLALESLSERLEEFVERNGDDEWETDPF